MARDASLPVGIVRRAEDHSYGAWELVYDYAIFRGRQHRYGEDPKWAARYIRVDEPLSMLYPASVPLDERDRRAEEDAERQRERRALVERWADEIVRGEKNHLTLRNDFQLEREVMDELWSRFREITGDRFLLNALSVQPKQDTPPYQGVAGEEETKADD
jgi:hypothetical protein